ncbi:UDP-N-acetylglucosamine 2-epimerase [Aliiglaciecola sp.]|nr:UDP-N-acetylglucosamine 2-epimerase [Aliiglaciecola sp.]
MRKVAVFTGNRAEYGLQFPILKAIDKHPDLDYQLIVSGAHLDLQFGSTLDEIKRDGFQISAEVKLDYNEDNNSSTAQAVGVGVLAMIDALERLKPDILIVYADRFEGFAAVIAATQMNIPTAHIEGGDLTEGGALDDSVRHAMSKLSHLHFTTNEQASNRLLAMGEESWRVKTVGLPSLDMISNEDIADQQSVADALNIDLARPVVLFTQHSVTIEFKDASKQIKPSITALKRLAEEGVQVIVTYPNNDAGGKSIIKEIEALDKQSLQNIQVHRSLGRYLYHSVLGLAKNPDVNIVCVGNSSSGLKETPIFGCPTVNVGTRQNGRLRGNNVIDASYSDTEIYTAIQKALSDEDFRHRCRNTSNPYFIGKAGEAVADVLAKVPLGKEILRKGMTLSGESNDGWYR